MPHLHPCDDCDVWFSCDELEIESEFREGCTVEPARCPDCQQSLDEKTYASSLNGGGAAEQIARGCDAMEQAR